MTRKVVLLVLLGTFNSAALAADCALSLPKALETSIATEKGLGWRVVSQQDLPQDDRQLWELNHASQCPGLTGGHFTGSAAVSYAVAFLKQESNEKHSEELIVFTLAKDVVSRIILVKPNSIISPFVVWKLPPGKYTGADGRPSITLANESFVYEKMESVATQYYFSGGGFHLLNTAD